MPNELAHQLTGEALKDFDNIDSRNSGLLNLVDIVNYERLGPEQKKVGQFLATNYDAIRSMPPIDTHDQDNPNGYMTKTELTYINQLSSSDPAVVNGRINSDRALGAMGGAIFGGAAGIAPVGLLAMTGMVAGPLAPLVGLAADAPFVVGGAILGANKDAAYDQQNVTKISKLGH